jgi:hypothetical protein
MKRLILTLTALTAFASGAFAEPTVILSLPATITAPGNYILAPDATAQPVVYGYPIAIFVGNVNLDLNGATIDTTYGMVIGNAFGGNSPVDHVTVKNGTFNGITLGVNGGGDAHAGVWIAGASYVSLLNLNFDGYFNGNCDQGSNDSIKNCNFESPLAIYADHGTYENLVVAKQPTIWSNIGNQDQSLFSAGNSNSFKNIRVLSGNVQLNGSDTYQHFFSQLPSTVNGGTNLQPGK